MTTAEENRRLTEVGPGTLMGQVMRSYWVPFALSAELREVGGAPIRVRLLGEDLVAYRDGEGGVGLVDARCPHRQAPLFFGRNEQGGLRCAYHGWKFDGTGQCVDAPSEPESSQLRDQVRLKAYPTWEGGNLVWAFMGREATQPPFPDYEWLRVPSTHFRVSKVFQDCNYLQGLEGGIDNAHGSFLHSNHLSDASARRLLNDDRTPRLEVEETPWGFRYASTRKTPAGDQYVRVCQFVMPFQQMRGRMMNFNGVLDKNPAVRGHIWVPLDDGTTCVFNWTYSRDESIPTTDEEWEEIESVAGRAADDYLPASFWLQRNRQNDYLIDRLTQRYKTFSGIDGINTQDFAVQEGMGSISPREKEHLGSTDTAIVAARRILLSATKEVEQGREPRGVRPEDHRTARGGDAIVPGGLRWQAEMVDVLTPRW